MLYEVITIDFGLITKYFTTVLIMLITSGICALAQYKFEFGGYVGGSSYLGDANATKLFAEPQSRITSYNVCYTKLLRTPEGYRPAKRARSSAASV